ncbi:MAG: TetR/AcrR family transcriptional regulator [Lachnospiraceae bacterium]
MPVIFNEKNKENIRENMLEKGFELLKSYGIRRMTVEMIAKSCGLAKGTFYTFFPSKEEFVFQIVQYKREIVKEKYTRMLQQYGKLGREELQEFFLYLRTQDVNVYKYLDENDMAYLTTKWPSEYVFSPQKDEQTTQWMLDGMRGVRKECNWKVFANYMKAHALFDLNRSTFHEDALPETQMVFQGAILDYLFGADTVK